MYKYDVLLFESATFDISTLISQLKRDAWSDVYV